jgi:prevent-host-death family protein
MLTLTTADARRQFANLIARVHTTKQRTILTRYGRPLVALVSMEDFHALGGASPPPGDARESRRAIAKRADRRRRTS